jgi:FkbM family methyltransferase
VDARLRELLRVGRCGPIARPLAYRVARLHVPAAELVAFGVLGKPRHRPVEVEVERDGFRWALDLRDDAHRLMFLDLYERELRARALELLPVGGRFVDAGANVGFWTLPAARRAGPSGQVVSFEPNPWAADRLERNRRLNDDGTLAPVELVRKAVGSEVGELELFSDDLEAGASQATLHGSAVVGSRRESVAVHVTTLDDVVDGEVDLLKMDVQGHESAVLRGGRRLFETSPPRHLVVEVQGDLLAAAGGSAEVLVAELEALGYRAVDGDGKLGREPVQRPLPPEFFETVVFSRA